MSPFAQFACDNGLNVRGKMVFLLLPLLLSWRNLKQSEVQWFQDPTGNQGVECCGWQQSAELVRCVWQGPHLLPWVIPEPRGQQPPAAPQLERREPSALTVL